MDTRGSKTFLSRIPLIPRKKVAVSASKSEQKEEQCHGGGNSQNTAGNGQSTGGNSQNAAEYPPTRTSKVAKYIKEMKGRQEQSRALALQSRPELSLSLEDLYLGEVDQTGESQLSPETTKTELRKSLRALKEKDMVINSLREACQDLSLKCADAENTIDQMRFRGNRADWSDRADRGDLGESSLRKCQSERQLCPKVTKDQSTETTVDVLSECCSSWMEKVKYWKTDSTFHASADADSGFRGSDLAEHEVLPRVRRGTTPSSLLQRAQMNRSSNHTTNAGTSTDTETKLETGDVEIPETANHQTGTENISTRETSRASIPLILNPASASIPLILDPASASRPEPGPAPRRSRSHTNLHWPTNPPITARRMTLTFDKFESLDKLLEEATAHARRVQRKSQRLSQLIQSVDKRV